MLLLWMLLSTQAFAQARKTITGTIADEKTGPLPGATVTEKGTKNATTTDANGFFTLSVGVNATLVITAVGYTTIEREAGTGTALNIELKQDTKDLNEVVITGFGDRKKSQIGSATTTVSGEDIRRTGAINPIAALQGLVPGMQVQPGIGGPQSTPVFRIRGSASLDPYNNQPLIVIDNIIMDQNVVLPNRGGNQDFGNILKDLNPDDIASVTVLRGGAVTALYGSRAQNGVIVITTKKGFSQRGLGISVTQNTQWDKAWKTMDFQNEFGLGTTSSAADFLTSPSGQKQINGGSNYNFGPRFTGEKVLDYDGREIAYSARPDNALDAFRTGISNNTNISIVGGGEKGTFRLSYSKNSSKGVTPNNNFDRNSVNFRATQRLLGKVLVDANVSYVRSKAKNAADLGGGNAGLSGNTDAGSVLINFVTGIPRYYDIDYWKKNYIAPQGGWNQADESGFASVLYNLYQNNRTSTDDNFRGSVDVRAPLVTGLEFHGNMNVNYLGTSFENQTRGRDSAFANPFYSTNISSIFTSGYRGDLNYTKKVGAIDVLLQGGGEYYMFTSKSQYSQINGAIYPDIYRLSNSRNPATTSEGKPGFRRLGSLFYQASLAYKNDVTLNIYGRNDWNSTLVYNDGHGRYSYFYPGVDMAWVFTETFKDKLPSLIDFGKLRLSYVQAGNGTSAYTANTGAYGANGVYTDYLGRPILNYQYQSNTLPNQDLKPERTTKIELGLEFRMFNNRLGGDLSYYTQDTKDQIISFGVPSTSGVDAALINGGKVRNRGLEIVLYGTPIKTRNFSWDTRFNYTRNRNTILSLPFGLDAVSVGGGDGYQAIAKVGGDYGTIIVPYGYAKYQATDASGKPIASPLNGKRVLITPAGTSTLYERAANYTQGLDKSPVVGSILPKFLGNWRNTLNYKNLQLVIGIDSKIGGMIYSATTDYGSWLGALKSTLPGRTSDLGGVTYTTAAGVVRNDGIIFDGVYRQGTTVTVNGQSVDLSGMTHQEAVDKGYMRPTSAFAYYVNSHSWFRGIRERAMFESSWVAVQQVSLTYDLPQSVANKFKMNGVRVGVYGNDLFFLYNNAPDNVNPYNINSSSSGAMNESSPMPYIRRIGVSLNASF